MDLDKYKALFLEQSQEHLESLSRLLIDLESTASPGDTIEEIFRNVHSIKGMAAAMGYDPIANLTHHMEDVIQMCRNRVTAINSKVIDVLLQATDAVGEDVQRVAKDEALGEHDGLKTALSTLFDFPEVVSESQPQRRVQVTVRLIDGTQSPAVRAFLAYSRLKQIGTVVKSNPSVAELRAGLMPTLEGHFTLETDRSNEDVLEALSSISSIDEIETNWQAQNADAFDATQGATSATVRVRTETLDALMDGVGELFLVRERLQSLLGTRMRADVRQAMDSLRKEIRDVHEEIMALRMMPLRTLTERYPRVVRDLARQLEKEVSLDIEDSEVEIDRSVLDGVDGPLIHLLRNAVDHGLETPEVRANAGKSRQGHITISAQRDREHVEIRVADDGAGLDLEKIRTLAQERGVISAEDALTSAQIQELVFAPGFSTSPTVSEISGRGVGLDAVRQKIESMGGSLSVHSTRGVGTTFIARLPLTLVIVPLMLVRSAGRVFAVPSRYVIAVRNAEEMVSLPTYSLAELLHVPSQRPEEFCLEIDGGWALRVEAIVESREAVVKPLGAPLDTLDFYSGAMVLGDGRSVLVLDVPRLRGLRVAA